MKMQSRLRGRAVSSASMVLALFLALLPPVGYFLNAYQYLLGNLDAQAELSARTVSSLVMANPATWQFETLRLSELLERKPLNVEPQERRILDLHGELIAEHSDVISQPKLVRRVAVYDAGVAVARVEVAQSLVPLIEKSLLIGVVSGILGVAVFLYFGIYYRRLGESALASLEESELRHRSIYQSMKEGMALFRRGKTGSGEETLVLIGTNPALAEMLGCSAEQVLRIPLADLFDGVILENMEAIFKAQADSSTVALEGRQSATGRIYSLSVFFPEEGLIAALVEDLTEFRTAQEERDQLERSMLQAQKLESLGVLAGGIAHDFNNLLVGILGNVDMALSSCPKDSPILGYLQRVERSAQRAAELTNQMLAYSGRGKFVVERLDISRVVEEMGHLLSTVVLKTAQIKYSLASSLPAIEADGAQVRQVVMNLITNASDAIGGKGGKIAVSTGRVDADREFLASTRFGGNLPEGVYAYVEVSDDGCGMDAATQERIFDPFFTTKEKGRGLGLASVLGIVRGHRGTFTVQSKPGEGTSIRIYFPVVEGAAPDEVAVAERRVALPAGSMGAILVVDDEDDVRELVQDMLETHGYKVLTARDGKEGVDLFSHNCGNIAAVILDMTMPIMSGGEAFSLMRSKAPEIPVILSSGYAELETPELVGLAAGFIQKPYRVNALLKMLDDVLAARHAAFSGSGGG